MNRDKGSRRAVAFRDLLSSRELELAAELVRCCNEADNTAYSVPGDADIYLLSFCGDGGRLDAMLAIWHLGDMRDGCSMDEVAAFTRPETRKRGLFKELFSEALPLLRPVIQFSVYENEGAKETLKSINAVYEHSEYMMELELDMLEDKDMEGEPQAPGSCELMEYELTEEDEDLLMLRTDYGEVSCRLFGSRAYIFGVLVYRSFRGRGLGSCLMKLILKRLRSKGVQSTFLQVSSANAPALRLYRSLGFKEMQKLDMAIKKLYQA